MADADPLTHSGTEQHSERVTKTHPYEAHHKPETTSTESPQIEWLDS